MKYSRGTVYGIRYVLIPFQMNRKNYSGKKKKAWVIVYFFRGPAEARFIKHPSYKKLLHGENTWILLVRNAFWGVFIKKIRTDVILILTFYFFFFCILTFTLLHRASIFFLVYGCSDQNPQNLFRRRDYINRREHMSSVSSAILAFDSIYG